MEAIRTVRFEGLGLGSRRFLLVVLLFCFLVPVFLLLWDFRFGRLGCRARFHWLTGPSPAAAAWGEQTRVSDNS